MLTKENAFVVSSGTFVANDLLYSVLLTNFGIFVLCIHSWDVNNTAITLKYLGHTYFFFFFCWFEKCAMY